MATLEQIIVCDITRGKGVVGDPVRTVIQYWSTDGNLLAERDPLEPYYDIASGKWMAHDSQPVRDSEADAKPGLLKIRMAHSVNNDVVSFHRNEKRDGNALHQFESELARITGTAVQS